MTDIAELAAEMRGKAGFVKLLDEGQSLWFAGETQAYRLGLVARECWKLIPTYPAWELTDRGREVATYLREHP